MDITRSHGLRLPIAAQDRLIASNFCFLHARETAGIPWKPKVRLAVHLVLSAGRCGNPRFLGNWMDESDKRKLSLVASTAAAPTRHKRVLSTFAHESGPSASSTRKKPKHRSDAEKRTSHLTTGHPLQNQRKSTLVDVKHHIIHCRQHVTLFRGALKTTNSRPLVSFIKTCASVCR